MPTIRERFLGRPIPTYRKHRASGQAVVTLSGKDIYLGPYGTKASRNEYDRLIGEWLAAGRCLAKPAHGDLTVAELGAAYIRFAEGYYRKDGRPTGGLSPLRLAVRAVRKQYGPTLAAEFGPLGLEAVRDRMVADGLARTTINRHVDRIRRMFRWAMAKQLVPPGVLEGLKAVPGLRRGRTEAREPEPVQPVADDVVDATLPHLPPAVADMIVFQRLTGCRPGEVCQLRPDNVDRSADVWAFRPRLQVIGK